MGVTTGRSSAPAGAGPASAQPALGRHHVAGPAGAGQRPQPRVEHHHGPGDQIGEALGQRLHARGVERSAGQLGLEEHRPFQLAALLPQLPEHLRRLHAGRHQRRHQHQQVEVGLVEVAAALVDGVEHADGPVLHDQRDRQDAAGPEHLHEPVDHPGVVFGVVRQVGPLGEEHPDSVPSGRERHVVFGDQLGVVDPEGRLLEDELVAGRVVDQEPAGLDVEEPADGLDQRAEGLLVVGGRDHRPAHPDEGADPPLALLGADRHWPPPPIAGPRRAA